MTAFLAVLCLSVGITTGVGFHDRAASVVIAAVNLVLGSAFAASEWNDLKERLK